MAPESELPLLAPLAAVRDPRPGEMIGEYRVESLLGEGGMATVFAAVHPLISKRAAIKVLSKRLCADPHAVERFLQEARTVNQIGHPNIVDVFAFGTLPDGRSYFVMEWLPGETLAARLLRGPLDFQTSLEVLCQVCEALEAAHEKRIIHRYLVDGRAQAAPAVKLLDFGIAKLVDSDVTVPRTRSGVTMGTAGYMSPEQARGRALDDRTDVYALGAMAYEMLLGRLPFVGESGIDILALHLTEPPPSPRELWPEIPPVLERLLLAMLEKSAARRPRHAHRRPELTPRRGLEGTPKRLGGSRARSAARPRSVGSARRGRDLYCAAPGPRARASFGSCAEPAALLAEDRAGENLRAEDRRARHVAGARSGTGGGDLDRQGRPARRDHRARRATHRRARARGAHRHRQPRRASGRSDRARPAPLFATGVRRRRRHRRAAGPSRARSRGPSPAGERACAERRLHDRSFQMT